MKNGPAFTRQSVDLKLVGVRGFEPPTTCTPCRYAYQAALRPEAKNYNSALRSPRDTAESSRLNKTAIARSSSRIVSMAVDASVAGWQDPCRDAVGRHPLCRARCATRPRRWLRGSRNPHRRHPSRRRSHRPLSRHAIRSACAPSKPRIDSCIEPVPRPADREALLRRATRGLRRISSTSWCW